MCLKELWLIICVSAIVSTANAQPAASERESMAGELAAYMNGMVEVKDFYGSVCVAQGDQVLICDGYGFANLEHGAANTPKTKFRIGSITKQFTAMAIMILHEQGKLDVDDPISKYLDDAPETWKDITIHHLLTHTSGIPSYTSMFDYSFKMMMPQSTTQMVDRFREKPLEFEPGSEFNYSNSGYFLLGLVVKSAAGGSYEAFLKEAIFDPLELNDTGYDRYGRVIPHRAVGYERRGESFVHAAYLDMSQPYAAGSLYSTVEDLRKWDQALRERKLLSESGYERMWKPEKRGYAYGWSIGEHDGKKTISHGGGINGFRSHILRIPEAELSVSVLCNVQSSDPARVAHELASVALGKDVPRPQVRDFVELDKALLKTYEGKYRVGENFVLVVRLDGDKLVTGREGRPGSIARPESETKFYVADVNGELTFIKNDDGQVVAALVKQGGMETRADRLD